MNQERPLDTELGKYLKRQRLRLGMRPSTLAKRVSKDESYIERLEAGEGSILLAEFVDLMNAMRIDPLKALAEVRQNVRR